MSQYFLNLIRGGKTAEVAAAVEEDPQLAMSRDGQGVSAFLWSIYSAQPLIRDFLRPRLAGLNIFEASALGDCALLDSLLAQDAGLVAQASGDGWTPLHLAAAFGGPEATALLLGYGADVHRFSSNPTHNQALHACIAIGRDTETARILLAHGADVNAEQAGGYTPLHQAAAAGLAELTALLLAAGADPSKVCHQGKTAADYASERHHDEVLRHLEAAAKGQSYS